MWIKVDASIRDHRKVWKAADITGEQIPTIIGCMVSLWTWCATNAPDGVLDDIPAVTVARAAQWPGNAEDFEKTLILCGFLDVDNETGTRSIHNWMNEDRAGGALEKLSDQREKANERKRRQRAAQRAAKEAEAAEAEDAADDSRAEQSRGCHADVTRDVTRMSRGREEKTRLDKSRKDIYMRGEAALYVPRADDASDASVTQVSDASCASDASADVTRDADVTQVSDASCASDASDASVTQAARASADVTRDTDDASDHASKPRRRRKADEPDAAFDAFWSLYPKKVARREAIRAWNKISHSEDVDAQIMEGVRRYAESVRTTEPAYIKNAQGWLNNERWKDEVTAAARTTSARADGPRDHAYNFDQIEAAAQPAAAGIATQRNVDYTEGFGDYEKTEFWQFLTAGGDDAGTDQQAAQQQATAASGG